MNWLRVQIVFKVSLGTLYRSRKSKDKFVNQPHPIKIEKTRSFFVFLKKSKIPILVFYSAHKYLLITLTFCWPLSKSESVKFSLIYYYLFIIIIIFYIKIYQFELQNFFIKYIFLFNLKKYYWKSKIQFSFNNNMWNTKKTYECKFVLLNKVYKFCLTRSFW